MSAAAEAVSTTKREIASGGVRIVMWLVRGLAGLRQLAPYAAIELLLPGGSLIALVLWLYRRQKKALQVAALSAPGQTGGAGAANSQSRISRQTSNRKKCPAPGNILTVA